MFLTKDEYLILKGIKEGLNYSEISQRYDLKLYTSDPRVMALYQKYGVLDRVQLMQVAGINKVDVIEADKMPYYQYDGTYLVRKLKIAYDDFKKFQQFFLNEKSPENKLYEITLNNFGIDSTLTIKESKR